MNKPDAVQFYKAMLKLWDAMGCMDREDDLGQMACNFLRSLAGEKTDELPSVLQNAIGPMYQEFDELPHDRRKHFVELYERLDCASGLSSVDDQLAALIWKAFFPQAFHLDLDPDRQIELLRKKRQVQVISPAPSLIKNVAGQMIFTSNILLTVPLPGSVAQCPSEMQKILQAAEQVCLDEQDYWYDHPIPMGISPQNDEVLYGLKGLSRALAFEKERGTVNPNDRLTVILSVSVTHKGLSPLALPWLNLQMDRADSDDFKDLDIYAFTEDSTQEICRLIAPWADVDSDELAQTFGVDGEYGRHYSFLKAMPAIWAVLKNPEIKGTFKIDLDQVFPQEELVSQTGRSAFEHFATPLWGAIGEDEHGRQVELGMLAGALVNEGDIAKGLFTPDIPWPDRMPQWDDLIFYKQRPMAVSTRAEMMCPHNGPDGQSIALQRIHVTGGTNGVLIDALRRYRPFTPAFIGRAEDQGYLFSVLFDAKGGTLLRYAHASGLIMRHDKYQFAQDAVKAGLGSSYIGDLVRIMVFSAYAEILPWDMEDIEDIADPFTGCYISPIPVTIVMLKLVLRLLSDVADSQKQEIFDLATTRLSEWIDAYPSQKIWLAKAWQQEKNVWDSFYNALDALEDGLDVESVEARKTAEGFSRIVDACRIDS